MLPKTFHSTTTPAAQEVQLESKPFKTLKAVRKLINPITVNYGLSSATGPSFESAEKSVAEEVDPSGDYYVSINSQKPISDSTNEPTSKLADFSSTTSTTATTKKISSLQRFTEDYIDDNVEDFRVRHFVESASPIDKPSDQKKFRTTVEIPPPNDLIDDYRPKQEPDQSPDYKIKPIVLSTTTTTDSPLNTSNPARLSRVNTAIKSLIAFGGTRRQNLKCHESQSADSKCNDQKQRYLFLVMLQKLGNLHDHQILFLILCTSSFNQTIYLFFFFKLFLLRPVTISTFGDSMRLEVDLEPVL